MAFVNEYIPEEDFAKYGIREIDASFPPTNAIPASNIKRRDWTIDRERNIYLRQVTRGRFEDFHLCGWTFYWRGELLWFLRVGIGATREINGQRISTSRISNLTIPAHLKPQQEEILNDLREAFNVYGDGGVFSIYTDYFHQLDFILDE